MQESLSSYVLERIRELDDSGVSEDLSREQYKEMQQIVNVLTRALLESRLTLTDQVAVLSAEATFRVNGDMLRNMFDDHYTRSLVKRVPKYVRRTAKLSKLVVKKIPSSEVRLYVREAARNYVFGHWISSIALARVAL